MITKTITLNVNGRAVTAAVEPRRHLADFLREELLLTGTHLGCEHGVCGACTLMIDGEIARSCITYAVACDGAEIRTIEAFDEDPVMACLRRTFSEEHGLQCGYCTPGMLIAARDIVTRLPEADERRIKAELSGNLCRCTGYMGIVKAVRKTLEARGFAPRVLPASPDQSPRAALDSTLAPERRVATRPEPFVVSETGPTSRDGDMTTLTQSFVVRHPRSKVWSYLQDVEKVVTCLPGASLTGPVRENRFESQMVVRLGPISATFAGVWDRASDDTEFRGVIEGSGRDARSATRVRGRVEYRLLDQDEDGDSATRIDIEVSFSLAGPLAQFSRGGIVRDLATRLTTSFADNLEARLAGPSAGAKAQAQGGELNVATLFLGVLWVRIKAAFASLFGRS